MKPPPGTVAYLRWLAEAHIEAGGLRKLGDAVKLLDAARLVEAAERQT